MSKTIRRKRRRYRINKAKFARFIFCCLVFLAVVIWIISSIINAICNMVFKHDEVATVDTIGKVEVVDIIPTTSQAYASEDIRVIDYSIKPEGLDNTYYEYMVEISENENVPLEVILAIVTTENETYNANSTYKNPNGTIDMGMCQINSAYVNYFADKYNIKDLDPYNVYDAVTFVARHMKYLSNYGIEKYNLSEIDSYIFAAGAYNRGLTNECKYRNMYHYKEKFMMNYDKFI